MVESASLLRRCRAYPRPEVRILSSPQNTKSKVCISCRLQGISCNSGWWLRLLPPPSYQYKKTVNEKFLKFSFQVYNVNLMQESVAFLNTLISTHASWVYLLAFLASAAEGIIVVAFVPGTTFVLLLGAFAAHGALSFPSLFLLVFLGAVFGALTGYFFGKRYGSKILQSSWVDKKYYFLAQDFIKAHGRKSIFLSRFVSGMKEFAPFIAGSLHMNKALFSFWNLLGCLAWTILFLGGGYYFGDNLHTAEGFLKIIVFVATLGFLSTLALYYVKNFDLKKSKRV